MEDEAWPKVRTICDSPDEIAAALEALPEYGEAVVIERDGKPLGAMIPMKDLKFYQRLFAEEEDRIDIAAVEEWHREGGETIPIEEVMRELRISPTP
jgi:hypothetical protein